MASTTVIPVWSPASWRSSATMRSAEPPPIIASSSRTLSRSCTYNCTRAPAVWICIAAAEPPTSTTWCATGQRILRGMLARRSAGTLGRAFL